METNTKANADPPHPNCMKTSNKSYKNESDLRDLYSYYNSMEDVADELDCSVGTIGNWMRKFGIESTDTHSNVRERDSTITTNTVCESCGEEFYKRPTNKKKTDHNFCSKECHGKWISDNVSGENHPQYNRVEFNCDNCGKTNKVIPSHYKNVDNHYCDHECFREDIDLSGNSHPMYSGGKISVQCEWCSGSVDVYPYRVEQADTIFCDRQCKGHWWSENYSGESHPQWKGGGSLYYGESWPTMRKRVQERDENTCQKCEKDESDLPRKPDVHHIKEVREFDDIEDAHTMDNMVQLCRGCHRTVERLSEKEQRSLLI